MENNNKRLENMVYLIAVVIILFSSFSPFLKTFKLGAILHLFLFPLAVFNIIVLKKRVTISKKKIILFGLILSILILKDLYNILHLDNKMYNLILILRIGITLSYFATVNKIQFYKVLEKIILGLSSIGLTLYTINFFNNTIFLKKFILKERMYFSFYGLYGYFSGRVQQNAGFTWEPSAWSILLGSLLMFRLIKKTEINFWNIILLLNILTSQSTTGYILALIMIGYLIITKISLKKIIIILLIMFAVLSSNKFREKVYYKISQRNSYKSLKNRKFEVGSSAARGLHQRIDFEIFKNNILFGESGDNEVLRKRYTKIISRTDNIAKYFLIKKTEYHISSNGLSYTLATHGIIIFILYFYLYFEKCFKNINRKSILYLITMLFIFTVQEANWLPYFIMLIFLQSILFQKIRRNG